MIQVINLLYLHDVMVLVDIGVKKKRFNGGKRAMKRGVAGKKARSLATQKSRAVANIRVGGFIGMEKKFLDTTSTTTAFTTAWAILAPTAGVTNCLSCPTQGTSESERDGRVYTIHSVHVRMTVTSVSTESQTAPVSPVAYRVCLVWDTQTNGAAITGTSVMDAGATEDLDSFRNLQNSKRFIILGDTGHVVAVRPGTNEGAINLFASSSFLRVHKFNKSFSKGIKVRCTGTTNNVSSVSDNSLSLIGLASLTAVTYTFETRVRFTG